MNGLLTAMTSLVGLLTDDAARPAANRPWPRALVTANLWTMAADQLACGRWTLLGLWGDTDLVHMAVLDDQSSDMGILSLECRAGSFPSVGMRHAPAIRLERAIHDLYGYDAAGLPDSRPWLDHGRWSIARPLGARPDATSKSPHYRFLPAEGEGMHQIPVGPVHAGIIEPGHFRFTANGETVIRLEERLGYVHKGIESLMAGADLNAAARLAGRVSGDSTVAYALAFARATEAALGVEVPPRARWLRGLIAEVERLANHFGDIGAVCNDAAFSLMHAHCSVLRERVLRAANACFGHRLMRDRIIPGGITEEPRSGFTTVLRGLVEELRAHFPELIELYDNTTSLQDRTVGTGVLAPALARQFGAGGFVGRASGRVFDARRSPGYPPYDELRFDVPMLEAGDVDARLWIRIREVEQSLSMIEQMLEQLPEGAVHGKMNHAAEQREGTALVESFRGDVLAWVRLREDGRVDRCHLRDPSWFQWPLLEAAIEGNIVADFPLCNKSFNCSYSGHDL
jgi:Ni,Fe-hydrogenase III large subunit